MSDNIPLNGHPRTVAPEEATGETPVREEQFDTAAALLRLVVGGVLVGTDELRARLERWQEATYAPTSPRTTTQMTPLPLQAAHNSAHNSVRHAVVGMLFETESRMRRRLSTMRARFWHLRHETRLYSTTLMPDTYTYWSPLDPLWMRLNAMRFRVIETVDHWVALGQAEEQQGRRMARQAAISVIDELLDYMAQNPEVRQLIEQQGMSMADTAVDEVRGRTAAADMWIERFARSLLRRPMSESGVRPAGSVEAPTPATADAQVSPSAARAPLEPSTAIAGHQP